MLPSTVIIDCIIIINAPMISFLQLVAAWLEDCEVN